MSLLSSRSVRLGLLAAACATAVVGCARDPQARIITNTRPVELVYNTGANLMDRGRWLDAVEYFNEVEQDYPATVWASRAALMTAYAHYRNANYEDAIADAQRFITEHQGSASTPYAYYILAVSYFDQIYDVGRDQDYTLRALNALRDITARYPRSEYAADARIKIDMVNDQLAGKEMTVGRYYLRDSKTLAAVGRFRAVVDTYQTTSHTPEALYRLVEAYLTLGLTEEAKRNGALLGFNYPGDRWYADAYRLLTDNGLQPAVPPTDRNAQRNAIQRLFQPGSGLAPPAVGVAIPAAAAPAAAPAPAAPAPAERRSLLGRLFGR